MIAESEMGSKVGVRLGEARLDREMTEPSGPHHLMDWSLRFPVMLLVPALPARTVGMS